MCESKAFPSKRFLEDGARILKKMELSSGQEGGRGALTRRRICSCGHMFTWGVGGCRCEPHVAASGCAAGRCPGSQQGSLFQPAAEGPNQESWVGADLVERGSQRKTNITGVVHSRSQDADGGVGGVYFFFMCPRWEMDAAVSRSRFLMWVWRKAP